MHPLPSGAEAWGLAFTVRQALLLVATLPPLLGERRSTNATGDSRHNEAEVATVSPHSTIGVVDRLEQRMHACRAVGLSAISGLPAFRHSAFACELRSTARAYKASC